MRNSNSNLNQDGFKPSPHPSNSWVELYLEEVHGNLHDLIPDKLAHMSQRDLADYLSTDKHTVSESWLSKWLRRNNYTRLWVRNDGAES